MLLALLLNLFLGATYFATKKALAGLPELTLVVVRTGVALACLVPLAGAPNLREIFRAGKPAWRRLLAMGGLGYALPLALGNYGVAFSSASRASLLIGTEPICVAVFGALLLGESLSMLRLAALAAGLAGATTVVSNGIPFRGIADTSRLAGDLLLIAHGAAWSIYTIAGKSLLGRFPPLAITTASLAVALPLLLPLAAFELPHLERGPALLPSLGWAVALGLLASALGTVLWNQALAQMDASTLAGFVFLQPVAGVLLGHYALGEELRPEAVVGGALVLAGVYLLAFEARRRGA
ncbi:MAG TPA: DMT family transporter [Myxococcota bacterium]|nr:DMT family transporter [Myxococcota bacterium]